MSISYYHHNTNEKLSPCLCIIIITGRITLSPSTMIAVCPGDQLALTCNTSSDVHQWIIDDNNTGSTYTRLIVSVSSSMAQVTPLQIQSFKFNFAIISPPSALPLISTLLTENVSTYLNTTRISCLEIDSGNMQEVTVHVFGPNSLESMLRDCIIIIHAISGYTYTCSS